MVKRSEEEWHQLFEAQQQSGQSAAAFCRARGLCPKYFSKRRRQLLHEEKTPLPCAPAFVPVAVTSAVQEVCLTLHVSETIRLTLPVSISAIWLAQFIHQLQA